MSYNEDLEARVASLEATVELLINNLAENNHVFVGFLDAMPDFIEANELDGSALSDRLGAAVGSICDRIPPGCIIPGQPEEQN